jgi:hypothetical protein
LTTQSFKNEGIELPNSWCKHHQGLELSHPPQPSKLRDVMCF